MVINDHLVLLKIDLKIKKMFKLLNCSSYSGYDHFKGSYVKFYMNSLRRFFIIKFRIKNINKTFLNCRQFFQSKIFSKDH